jgi:SiaC family regulatory phosphoprotein
MENLFIEATEYSPKILFDVKNRKFELTGISRPEDVIAFYESVLYKIENYIRKTIENNNDLKDFTFNLKFDLTYMNSASSKYILQILDHFKQLFLKEANIIVDWLYEDVDDQIFEDGEDLSDVIKIPFNLIAR